MTTADQAVYTFKQGFNCSQAILSTFAERLGMERSEALRLATGFGGGIGGTGNICGAVSGAIMGLGLKFGISEPDKPAKARMYEKTRHYLDQFRARFGSIECRDLLGFDLSTPEGQQQAKTPGAFDCCDRFVYTAAELLESMLDQ